MRKDFYAKLQQFDALFCFISIVNKALYKYICTHKYKYTLDTSTHYTQRFYWYLKSIFWLSVKDWFWDPLSSTCCNLRYSFCMQPSFPFQSRDTYRAGSIVLKLVPVCIALFKANFWYIGPKTQKSYVTFQKWILDPECWRHSFDGQQKSSSGYIKRTFRAD